MRTIRTRVIHAAPPLCVSAGFVVRTILNGGPPLSLQAQIDQFAYPWALSFEAFCLIAGVASLFPTAEWTLRLGAIIRFLLGWWVMAVAAVFFFRPEAGAPYWSHAWWLTRDYTLTGTIVALAAFFFGSSWDLIHFHLPNYQGEKILVARFDELDHLHPSPKEE